MKYLLGIAAVVIFVVPTVKLVEGIFGYIVASLP